MWPVVVLDDVVFPAQSKQYHDVTAWREGEIGSSSGAVLSRSETCVCCWRLSYCGVMRMMVLADRNSDGGEAVGW